MSPATRASVLAAIRDLGYRPNAAARTLVTGRTNMLGVISIDTTLFGPASMLYGIERAAHPGYSVAIASLAGFDRMSMAEAVDGFLGQAVDGIIVIAPETAAVEALTSLATDVPLVAVGCGIRAPLFSVAIDNLSGAAKATQYLLDLGHETVHHIGGPDNWVDAQERVEGWRRTLRAAGAPEPADAPRRLVRSIRLRDRPRARGRARRHRGAVRQRSDGPRPAPRPRRARPRVPADVSVVGFDDVPEAAFFLPPLTTVRQDFGELGKRALRLRLDRISAQHRLEPTLPIEPEMVVRASAGPATGRRPSR